MFSGSAKRGHNQSPEITIRPFAERDASEVRELFIAVNQLLSPPDLREAFEAYIKQALAQEIDRIAAYYSERNGDFWVAVQNDRVVGTFGLERASSEAMELRRMYVDPAARRAGIGRRMLCFAEEECRRRGTARLNLSTAEIQEAALALYRNAGYRAPTFARTSIARSAYRRRPFMTATAAATRNLLTPPLNPVELLRWKKIFPFGLKLIIHST